MRGSRLVFAPLCAVIFVFAACGSGKDKGSASTTSTTPKSTQATVPPPPTSPPTKIGVTESLTKTPPTGKTILYLQCELPACARTVGGIKTGAAALGWKSEVSVYKNATPGAGLQAAIQRRPDYIAITGI